MEKEVYSRRLHGVFTPSSLRPHDIFTTFFSHAVLTRSSLRIYHHNWFAYGLYNGKGINSEVRVGTYLFISYLYSMKDTTSILFKLTHPAYQKTCKVVESCETLEQYESSLRMVKHFYTFLDSSIKSVEGTDTGTTWVLKSYYTSNLNQLILFTSRNFS
jgi:hypothetical protein